MSKNLNFSCQPMNIQWNNGIQNGFICKKYIEDFESTTSPIVKFVDGKNTYISKDTDNASLVPYIKKVDGGDKLNAYAYSLFNFNVPITLTFKSHKGENYVGFTETVNGGFNVNTNDHIFHIDKINNDYYQVDVIEKYTGAIPRFQSKPILASKIGSTVLAINIDGKNVNYYINGQLVNKTVRKSKTPVYFICQLASTDSLISNIQINSNPPVTKAPATKAPTTKAPTTKPLTNPPAGQTTMIPTTQPITFPPTPKPTPDPEDSIITSSWSSDMNGGVVPVLTTPNINYNLTSTDYGSLVVYHNTGRVIWSSNTSNGQTNKLVIQNDGNLTLNDSSGNIVWQTNTGGNKIEEGPFTLRIDDTYLVGLTTNTGRLLWSNTQSCLSTINNGLCPSQGMFFPNGYALIIEPSDNELRLYDNHGNCVWENLVYPYQPCALVMHDDGNLTMSTTGDGTLVWETNSGGNISEKPFNLVMTLEGYLAVQSVTTGRIVWTNKTVETTTIPTTKAPTTMAPTPMVTTTMAPTPMVTTTMAPTPMVTTTMATTTRAQTTKAQTTKAQTTRAPTTKAPTTKAPTTMAPTTMAPTSLIGTRIFKPNGENPYSYDGVVHQLYTSLGTFPVPLDYVEGNDATVTLSGGGDINTRGEVNFGIAKGPEPSQGSQIAWIFDYSDVARGKISSTDPKFNNVVKKNIKLGKPGDILHVGVNLSYPGQSMINPSVKVEITY